ncbi:hypothetical protein [Haladaptatus caseinilyticus]|uniref:hypothetical protein n=1 Tax=Haladaptatus caseinilyticus TaxID=2993314 RepID=UPI00224B8160|nr:hypothetical protein [Haladaptatus caseinilyticus]
MSEFETARGRCRIEDGTIRIQGGAVGALRKQFRHDPVQFLALFGFYAVTVGFLWWLSSTFAFIDPVFVFAIAVGAVVMVLLFGHIQARFTRLSLTAEIPVSTVKKVVYVDGGKWSKPRFSFISRRGMLSTSDSLSGVPLVTPLAASNRKEGVRTRRLRSR